MRFAIILSAVVAFSIPAQALAEDSGYRQILSIGCHLVDNTCFVEVSGLPAGPAGCRSTSFRWNQKSAPNGQSILSLLTQAHLARNSVNFYLADANCYANQVEFPTFLWINVR